MIGKAIKIVWPLLLAVSCSTAEGWKQKTYEGILSSLKETQFKSDTLCIADLGAVADDSLFMNDTVINKAIATMSARGGGVVCVPQGIFYTAGLILKDNVNLHLEKGSILRFSTSPEDYLPVVWTKWEGYDCLNYRPLIYGRDVYNVAITGEGVIDGNASNETWWWMCGYPKWGYKPGMPSARTLGKEKLSQMVADGVEYHDRIMGDGAYLRPQLLNIMGGENILVEGVSFINSPFWVIHPVFCRNVIVRRVTVDSHGPNNDGCDPESCSGVLIEDCHFRTGDDCIAVKSGRNQDGRMWSRPCEDIIVRNCLMEDGHGAITIGSEISGGVRNMFVHNCTINSEKMYNAVRIKTNTCRGGVVENIFVRDIDVLECWQSSVIIDLRYDSSETNPRIFYPCVKNVFIDNLRLGICENFITIDALSDSTCVENVIISNCSVRDVKKVENISGKVRNLKINCLLL